MPKLNMADEGDEKKLRGCWCRMPKPYDVITEGYQPKRRRKEGEKAGEMVWITFPPPPKRKRRER